jgi:hypothetical protein
MGEQGVHCTTHGEDFDMAVLRNIEMVKYPAFIWPLHGGAGTIGSKAIVQWYDPQREL